jgi:anti-sigma factor RsiW
MIGHPDERQLNDFVDGALDATERAATAAHVDTCTVCGGRVAVLRTLQAQLRALPREIAPPDELLAAIHAGMAAGPAVSSEDEGSRHTSSPRWHARPALLAAAAVVLVAVSSATTALLLRSGASDPPAVTDATDSAGAPAARLVAAHPIERSYEAAIAELEREISAPGSALAPETLRVVEHNIRVIDQALAEARAALQADPSNAALADMLRSGYDRKLDVLRSAAAHVRPAS